MWFAITNMFLSSRVYLLRSASVNLHRILSPLCQSLHSDVSQISKPTTRSDLPSSSASTQNTFPMKNNVQIDATSGGDLIITDECVKQLKSVADNGEFLRIAVDGGGCSGFEYKFSLDSTLNDDDTIFRKDTVSVVVDSLSLEYIKGSTIDYKEELIRSAFRVAKNPLAEKGCSCGASFALKMD